MPTYSYKEAYARIRREYETKYLAAREAADMRRSEVHLAIPEVEELDRQLQMTGLSLMGAATSGEDVEARILAVRRRNAEIRRRRTNLLKEHGYPADYTEVQYECPVCSDSGYVDCVMCSCLRKKLVEAAMDASGIGDLLRRQTFDSFNLAYYEADPAAHRRMTQIYGRMKQYADRFTPGVSESLILFGGTGLGKTHLSSAVAGVVIEKGYDVLYTTAVDLISEFELQRFGTRSISAEQETTADTSRFFDADLLIIDDLGTEVVNQFTTSVLYNLINTRIMRHAATIISTNLSQDEFHRRYWDRITSRVFGEYIVLPFLGTDVRALKLRQ